MNDSDPFAVVNRAQVQKQKTAPKSDVEPYLWAFFDAWEALHAIQGDGRKAEIRKKREDAAQALVDAAQPLRALRGNHG